MSQAKRNMEALQVIHTRHANTLPSAAADVCIERVPSISLSSCTQPRDGQRCHSVGTRACEVHRASLALLCWLTYSDPGGHWRASCQAKEKRLFLACGVC